MINVTENGSVGTKVNKNVKMKDLSSCETKTGYLTPTTCTAVTCTTTVPLGCFCCCSCFFLKKHLVYLMNNQSTFTIYSQHCLAAF